MFTADEYRTAIKVLRDHSCEDLAEGFVEFAKRAEKKERYAETLGRTLDGVIRPGEPSLANGLRVYHTLLGAGWTPPEGLF
jgi:hypothetical protein